MQDPDRIRPSGSCVEVSQRRNAAVLPTVGRTPSDSNRRCKHAALDSFPRATTNSHNARAGAIIISKAPDTSNFPMENSFPGACFSLLEVEDGLIDKIVPGRIIGRRVCTNRRVITGYNARLVSVKRGQTRAIKGGGPLRAPPWATTAIKLYTYGERCS